MADTYAAQRILEVLPRSAFKVSSKPVVSWNFFDPTSSSIFRPYLWDETNHLFVNEQGVTLALKRSQDTLGEGSYGVPLRVAALAGEALDYGIDVANLGTSFSLTAAFKPNWDLQPAGASVFAPFRNPNGNHSRIVYDEQAGRILVSGWKDPSIIAAYELDETAGNVGSDLLANGDFETYPTTPGAPTSWTVQGDGVTLSKETSQFQSGATALRVTKTGGTSGLKGAYQAITPTAAHSYYVEAYGLVNSPSGGTAFFDVFNVTDNVTVCTVNVTSAGFTKMGKTFQAIAGKTYRIRVGMGNATAASVNDYAIIDKVSVKEIVAKDSSGLGQDLTLAVTPASNVPSADIAQPGALNFSYGFTGNGATVGTDSFQRSGNGSFSVRIWAKPTALAIMGIFLFTDPSNGGIWSGRLFMSNTSGKLEFDTKDGTTEQYNVSSSVNLVAGTRYRLGVTYDETTRTATIYVNGIAVGSGTSAVSAGWLAAGTSRFRISPLAGTTWNGTLDQPVVNNRCLTAAEMLADYNGGTALPLETNLYANLGWTPRQVTAATLTVDAAADKSYLTVNGTLAATLNKALTQDTAGTMRLHRESADALTGITDLEAYFFHAAALTLGQTQTLHAMYTVGFTGESRWVRHAIALAMMFGEIEALGWKLYLANRPDYSSGGQLTQLAKDFSVPRKAGETDTSLRTRLKNRLLEIFSNGSIFQLIQIAAERTGLLETDIVFRNLTDSSGASKPMNFTVQLPPGQDSKLADLLLAMQAAALAGVTAGVGISGSFAWDTQAEGWDLGGWNYVR